MIKIGDFSRLAHVSVKALHHYGYLGLLEPTHVDRYTGYRYYSLDQLARLNQILALKDLGFSLDQIAQLLREDLAVAEIRGMLRLKQIELAERIQAEESRLTRVANRLSQLESGGAPPRFDIAIKDVPAQVVLAAQAVAASEEAILPARQSLQALLQKQLAKARLKPTSPWFSIRANTDYQEDHLEIQLAVGITPRANQRAGDWGSALTQLLELPAIPQMASLIHPGEYATITGAYTGLYRWTQANGYQITGPYREIYLPETGLQTGEVDELAVDFTEVQCPIEKAKIPISIRSTPQKEHQMEPKIVSKDSFKAAGLAYIGKNENGEIPQMWGAFNARSADFAQVNINSNDCYGLCFAHPQNAQEGEFEYVAAVEVDNDQNLPEGAVYREVPAYRYAVFTHKGKLDTLGETYQYIYETWLPQSGYEIHPDKYDMEVYDERFIPDSDDSALDIYVAIQ